MAKWKLRGRGFAKQVERDDVVVATVLQCSNGMWSIFDTEEKRALRQQRYATAQRALAFIRENPDVVASPPLV